MPRPWLKSWHKSLDNPKIMNLTEVQFTLWHKLLWVACRNDHLGSFGVCQPRGLEADSGTPADHEERLTGELRASANHGAPAPGAWIADARSATST